MQATSSSPRLIILRTLLALAFLLFVISSAHGATYSIVSGSAPFRTSYTTSQALTQTAPTAPTEGAPVPAGVRGCTVTAQAQAGATLTDLTLTAYVYEPSVGLWGKANLSLGAPVAGGGAASVGTIAVTGVGDRTFSAALPSQFISSLPKSARIDFVSTGTTVSAGTAITVFLSCW